MKPIAICESCEFLLDHWSELYWKYNEIMHAWQRRQPYTEAVFDHIGHLDDSCPADPVRVLEINGLVKTHCDARNNMIAVPCDCPHIK